MSEPNVVALQSDIISRFMQMTEDDDTPFLYRKWAAISLVAGALERRVWAKVGNLAGRPRYTYPNLYVFLVGAPGVGKFIVSSVKELWSDAIEPGTNKPAFRVARSNMTKASMIDGLADAVKSFLPPKGPPYEYTCMLIAAEEFGVFLPSYDINFIAVLNEIYNAAPSYSETRRHGPAREIVIVNPLLNILGGMQPVWMNSVFPQQAWGMGLFSRVIMVYASAGEPVDMFAEGHDRSVTRRILVDSLSKLSKLFGEIMWQPEAVRAFNEWHLAKGPPIPDHSKLEHYIKRRSLHAAKLSMISSVSRTGRVGFIESSDVMRAIGWLVEAETVMPDIFRSMIGQSDHEIIEELYNHVSMLFGMSKGTAIQERQVFNFLIRRVPSEKISKILEAAERSNMIVRVGGTDTYKPRTRREFAE